MKKILLIAYILLICIPHNRFVLASNTYAKITSNYAYLYRSASSEIDNNVICYLEETYFVEITLNYNAEFYKVNYNGVNGYVLKDTVTTVIGVPSKPFPSTTITSGNTKCYLRSSPRTDIENIVTVIPEQCTDLKYIGKIYGEEAIDYQGNLWYMVSYFGVQGYVYSRYLATVSPIYANTEVLQNVNNNLDTTPSPLNNIECAIIITVLSIPIILIIIIMYRQPNRPKTKKRKIVHKPIIEEDELL